MRMEPYSADRTQDMLRMLNLTRERPIDLAGFFVREERWAAGDLRQRWFGLEDGNVVAMGQLTYSPYAPDSYLAGLVAVDPGRHRSGLGTRMLEFLEHEATLLAFSGLTATVAESAPCPRSWLDLRGFHRHAVRCDSLLDLRLAHRRARLPQGLSLSDMSRATEARWQDAAEIMRKLVADAPDMQDVPRWSVSRCLSILRETPGSRPDWVIAAKAGDQSVGLAVGHAIGAEVYSYFTGVAPDWRGRGVGRALKLALISAARKAGMSVMRTTNLEANAPARSLNASLGFKDDSKTIELRKPLARPQSPAAP
jgi:GNAT superfamily N-acetyltransferase